MPSRTARALLVLAQVGCAALALSSCDKKKSIVGAPPPFSDVIGTPSSSQLIVYPDVPLTTYFLQDTVVTDNGVTLKKSTCSADDTLLATTVERAASSTTIHGYIFDYTPASEFQAFRREGSGGFRLVKDFPLQPVKRYPAGGADVFTFDDPQAAPSGLETYLARGVIGGSVTASSPLTNLGTVTVTPTASILYTGRTNICGDTPGQGETPPDSLLPMSWSAVPGAAGYWVQVYQFGVGANVFASRFPAPAVVGRSVDYFLAYFPGTVTSYKLRDPLPAGARVLTEKTLFNNTDYAVRITAVNSDGQLIAYPSQASRAFFLVHDISNETHYSLQTLGAFVVHTGNPGACPNNPPCGQALGTALPNVKVFPPSGLPTALQ